MNIQHIHLRKEFNAPVERVWADFSDHAKFGKIMGIPIERIKDSDETDDVNGINSVRLLKLPLFPFEETIRKSVKNECLEYQISKGTPLNHHYGSIAFISLPDGRCAVDYSIELGSNIPLLGLIIKTGLQAGLERGLDSYAKRFR